MFNIKDEEFHVYYPVDKDPRTMYINSEQHNVPDFVHKGFPFLTVIDKEVYINGYVYDQNKRTWRISPAKKFINTVIVSLFIIIMFTILT